MQQKLVCHHSDWELYALAFETAMDLFDRMRLFPSEEKGTLTDPLCLASRSLCATLAQAWRKRFDDDLFRTKLDEAETLAAEIQAWLEFAQRCGYLDTATGALLMRRYSKILGKIVWLRPVAPAIRAGIDR